MRKTKDVAEINSFQYLNSLTCEYLQKLKVLFEIHEDQLKIFKEEIDQNLISQNIKQKFHQYCLNDWKQLKEHINKRNSFKQSIYFNYVEQKNKNLNSKEVCQFVERFQISMKNSLNYILQIQNFIQENEQREQQISLKQDLIDFKNSNKNIEISFDNFVHSVTKQKQDSLFNLDITPIKYQSQRKSQGESLKKNLNIFYSKYLNLNHSLSPKQFEQKNNEMKFQNIFESISEFCSYLPIQKINCQNQEDSDKSREMKKSQKQKKELTQNQYQIQKLQDDIPKFVFSSEFLQSATKLNKASQINLSNEEPKANSNNDNETNIARLKDLQNAQYSSNDLYLKLNNDQYRIEIKISNSIQINECNLKKFISEINQKLSLIKE
ncbi:hypothetical protein TTHERM_001075602 (macronuclear) [Tetrahymena thermophila SB210]|uniref:Uncharacterized protein n=1 Tax=Tetrahymena thermophila (strain SB210) TaxID=312017 RepID=W7XGN4_TETTS|nr:hypothetical protein TTHERM_001075602 [Tetrahymena thermophila SB210]EWS72114.1 hypothetical protein TTHERM_001075602 [Tetrahymena thermophila SB210]|eukprot:XP_012655348.1 hypothetical protein TTHERM_001075602 [Tetrahymena thermophila SB210]